MPTVVYADLAAADAAMLEAEIAAADPVPAAGCIGVRVDEEPDGGYTVSVMLADDPSGAERTALDAVVAAHDPVTPTLEVAKAAKRAAIDRKTSAVIAAGFAHSGKVFSLSLEAQSYWTNMYQAREMLTYPLRVNTLDDGDAHDVADVAEVSAMYGAAVEAVRAALAGGTSLKDAVRAATTVAEVAAVVDTR